MTDRERLMVRVAARLGVPAAAIAAVTLDDWSAIVKDAVELSTPEPQEPRCSVCGLLDSANEYGPLVPIRVVAALGEEGYADVTQLLCDEHMVTVCEGLVKLGFKDHRHGGADFLEDTGCPGADDMLACPTPSGYGEYVVGQLSPGSA